MKFTVGTRYHYLVTRIQAEDIGGYDTGIHIHPSALHFVERRCCYTDIQHDDITFGRIIGHGVGTYRVFLVLRRQIPHLELIPITLILFIDIEIGISDLIILGNPDLAV